MRVARLFFFASISSAVRNFSTLPAIEKAFDVQINHPVRVSRHYAGLIGIQED